MEQLIALPFGPGDRLIPLFGISQNNASPFDPAALAIINAMSPTPNGARQTLINSTVVSLKGANLWTKFALLYVTAAAAQQPATINWVSPSTATLTAVNSPTFTTDRGFTGDGTTSYLDSGMAQNALSPYAQDAAHLGTWALTAGTINKRAIGLNGSTINQIINNAAAGSSTNVNGGSFVIIVDAINTGYIVATRRSSAAIFAYRNGGTETTGAAISVALVANTASVLRGNSIFSDAQIALAHWGDQLSATDVSNLYTIMQTYLHAVGAV